MIIIIYSIFLQLVSPQIVCDKIKDFQWPSRNGHIDDQVSYGIHFFIFAHQKVQKIEQLSSYPLIVFTGSGPGMSSQFFNYFGTGPYTLNSFGELIENQQNYTDIATLVYLDMAGAGYSRQFQITLDKLESLLIETINKIQSTDCLNVQFSKIYLASSGQGVKTIIKAAATTITTKTITGLLLASPFMEPSRILRKLPSLGFQQGLLDIQERSSVEREVLSLQYKSSITSSDYWRVINTIAKMGGDVNIRNFQNVETIPTQANLLITFLNKEETKKSLKLSDSSFFDSQNVNFYDKFKENYMKNDTQSLLAELLENDCKILLVGNQLSLAINFAGTLEWVNELTWSENKSLGKQQLKMVNEGVEKQLENLKFYGLYNYGEEVWSSVEFKKLVIDQLNNSK